jgi:hypothetical protein
MAVTACSSEQASRSPGTSVIWNLQGWQDLGEVRRKRRDGLWLRRRLPQSLLAGSDSASRRWRTGFGPSHLERHSGGDSAPALDDACAPAVRALECQRARAVVRNDVNSASRLPAETPGTSSLTTVSTREVRPIRVYRRATTSI